MCPNLVKNVMTARLRTTGRAALAGPRERSLAPGRQSNAVFNTNAVFASMPAVR